MPQTRSQTAPAFVSEKSITLEALRRGLNLLQTNPHPALAYEGSDAQPIVQFGWYSDYTDEGFGFTARADAGMSRVNGRPDRNEGFKVIERSARRRLLRFPDVHSVLEYAERKMAPCTNCQGDVILLVSQSDGSSRDYNLYLVVRDGHHLRSPRLLFPSPQRALRALLAARRRENQRAENQVLQGYNNWTAAAAQERRQRENAARADLPLNAWLQQQNVDKLDQIDRHSLQADNADLRNLVTQNYPNKPANALYITSNVANGKVHGVYEPDSLYRSLVGVGKQTLSPYSRTPVANIRRLPEHLVRRIQQLQ